MADDLAAMKARIKRELARGSALDTDIAEAITTAIKAYQGERFRFSSTKLSAPPTFNTVIGRDVYTSADNANIGSLLKIDAVYIQIGNTLEYLTPGVVDDLVLYNSNGVQEGQPDTWAYRRDELLLSPIPSNVWAVTLELFREVPVPVDDAEVGNPWMIDAEALIRSRAKYEVALHRMRNDELAKAMSPLPPAENGGTIGAAYREWQTLKRKANRVASRGGRVRPVQF